MRKIIAALALLTTAAQGNAAEFNLIYRPGAAQRVIHMSGPINYGDETKAAIAFASDAKAIELDSNGGNVVAAIRIGDMIAQRGITTIVDDNTTCASACAFIWLGGTRRFLSPTARLGFHGAYILNGRTISSTSSGNALVGAYMARMQLKDEAIEYLTTAKPNQMTWMDVATVTIYGIRSEAATSEQMTAALRYEQQDRERQAAKAAADAQEAQEAKEKAIRDAAWAVQPAKPAARSLFPAPIPVRTVTILKDGTVLPSVLATRTVPKIKLDISKPLSLPDDTPQRAAADAANAPKSVPIMAYPIRPLTGRAKPFQIKPPLSILPVAAEGATY